MKYFNTLILSTILFFSCNVGKNENGNVQTINPEEIQVSPIQHDTLSADQIEKIALIQSTFFEVYQVSLEQTITDFKRDLNPDSEIEIWLKMADTYRRYLATTKPLDIKTKKEVYRLILSRSMMPDEEAIKNSKLRILSEDEAKKVLSFYSADPDPIDVIKK